MAHQIEDSEALRKELEEVKASKKELFGLSLELLATFRVNIMRRRDADPEEIDAFFDGWLEKLNRFGD